MSDRRYRRELGLAMNIILSEYRTPDKGTFEIHQLVTLEVSSAQACKLVNRFLLMEVSTLLTADAPGSGGE
jgi:hypothetical protein